MTKFTDGRIVNLAWVLESGWINEHPKRTTPTEEALETEEHPPETIGPNIPYPQYMLEGVPHVDEDSQAQRGRMKMFCLMQDFYAHTGLLGHYLTHEVDMWGTIHIFKDRYLGDPPSSLYRHY